MEITLLKLEHKHELEAMIKTVLTDLFTKNEILHLTDLFEEQLNTKLSIIKSFFEKDHVNLSFVVAIIDGKIVGTMEAKPVSDDIINGLGTHVKDEIEFGSVFVLPEYQRRGVATNMIEFMESKIKEQGKNVYYLDSGYETAVATWTNKYGKPTYVIKDYWADGVDNSIWEIGLE